MDFCMSLACLRHSEYWICDVLRSGCRENRMICCEAGRCPAPMRCHNSQYNHRFVLRICWLPSYLLPFEDLDQFWFSSSCGFQIMT